MDDLFFVFRVLKANEPGGNKACNISNYDTHQIDGDVIADGSEWKAGDSHRRDTDNRGSLDSTAKSTADAGSDERAAKGQGNTINEWFKTMNWNVVADPVSTQYSPDTAALKNAYEIGIKLAEAAKAAAAPVAHAA